jgi:polysaccharide biosynthesis protein PslG
VSGRQSQAAVALGALVWIGTVAVVVLLHRGAGENLEDAAPLPRPGCSGLAVGVHSTLAFEGDPERREATVTAIQRSLNAEIVRDSLLWSQVEPVEGERDWSRTDRVVEELRAAGIEPLFAVVGSPGWANGAPESSPDRYLYVPQRGEALDAWLAHYSDFLAAAVDRYRDFIKRWEIWNEPNLAAFWRPRPDPVVYAHVYETLRSTILREDPSAHVAVGGLTNLTAATDPDISGRAFLRGLIRMHAPLDGVAVHPYTTDDHPPGIHVPGENNFDDIERVRDQLAGRAEQAPIWVTEWGWSSATVGESRQARYVDRSMTMLESRYHFVRVATYFVDHDRPPEFFQGLLDEDLTPKPAALAFRKHADLAASRCEPSHG